MGEKYVRVVFGAFEEDIDWEPDGESWGDWFEALPEAETIGKYDKGLCGATFETPYESQPRWLGFCAFTMNYGDTWCPDEDRSSETEEAWRKLQQIVEKTGKTLPEGRYIAAFDE